MKNKKGKTLKGVIRGNFRKYGVFVKTLYHGPEEGTRVGYFCRNIPVAVRLYGWCMAAVLWLVYVLSGGYIKLFREHFHYFPPTFDNFSSKAALLAVPFVVVIYFICKFLELAKSEKVWLRILFWFTVVGIMAIIVLYVAWRVYVAGVKVTVWNENRLNLKWREQGSYFTMAFDFLIAPVFFTVMIRDHFRIFRSLLMSGVVIPYLLLCVENPYVIVLSIVMIVKIIFVLLVIILVVGLISLLDEGGSGRSGSSGGLIIENIGDGIWAIFEI